jgi:hypothetical protein
MKTVFQILAGLLCFTVVSQADVFVYRNKISYTVTGGGGATKNSATGWTILDESGNVVQVLGFTATKRYAIVPMQSIQSGVADTGAGKLSSFFLQHDVWSDGDGHTHIDTGGAKGLNTPITVNGTARSIPKTYAWSGRSSYPANSSGDMKYEESTGTFSFDPKWTDTCNAGGDDLNAAAQRLAAELVRLGYQEF